MLPAPPVLLQPVLISSPSLGPSPNLQTHAWFAFYLHLHHADNTLTLDNITSFMGRLFASFCSPNLKTVPRHIFPSVPQRQKEFLSKHANPQFSLLGLTAHEPHAFAPVQTRVHCLLHAPAIEVAFTS